MNQIVVFHMRGCPACKEYLPRFKAIAAKYKDLVVTATPNVDKADKRIQDAATKYKVTAAPTTVVLDANDKLKKRVVGGIDNGSIEALFAFATK
jgi:thiol-disulfide isomerase/thioredoxin